MVDLVICLFVNLSNNKHLNNRITSKNEIKSGTSS
jgi:hypothetical protein